jgi:hypothetical protein
VSEPLRRFWWVVVLGVCLSVAIAARMIYELPSLALREPPVYSATARLLVSTTRGEPVRLSTASIVDPASAPRRSGGQPALDDDLAVAPLLAAANVYPVLIESDEVAQLRRERYGAMPGTVVASAYTAVRTTTRFSPAQLPVVDIAATSSTAREAMALAQATADTFELWIRRAQDREGVAPRARIRIEQLRAPRDALASGGPSWVTPIVAAVAVMCGFAILPFILDQLFPRGAVARWLQSETS